MTETTAGATQEWLSTEALEHIPALRRYARVLMRTPDQADDLVQDTLERALSRSHLYQPGTNLRAWLFTMMRNMAITQTRKEKLRRAYASEQMQTQTRSSSAGQMATVELKQALQAMKGLSSGEQQALSLLGVNDLSYEQAAQIAGLPIGTMKSRLSRGRARLREQMGA